MKFKFRVYDKILEVIIYNVVLYAEDENTYVGFSGEVAEKIFKTLKLLEMPDHWDYFKEENEEEIWYYIDKEISITQFIGEIDKNGKEIFVDDIIKDEKNCIFKVIFYKGMFICKNLNGEFLKECNWEKFEKIGNIYKNEELLIGG